MSVNSFILTTWPIKVPLIDVSGKMKNFSCFTCEQGYKNKKIGDYKFFTFFCKLQTLCFVVVRTGPWAFESDISRRLLRMRAAVRDTQQSAIT